MHKSCLAQPVRMLNPTSSARDLRPCLLDVSPGGIYPRSNCLNLTTYAQPSIVNRAPPPFLCEPSGGILPAASTRAPLNRDCAQFLALTPLQDNTSATRKIPDTQFRELREQHLPMSHIPGTLLTTPIPQPQRRQTQFFRHKAYM